MIYQKANIGMNEIEDKTQTFLFFLRWRIVSLTSDLVTLIILIGKQCLFLAIYRHAIFVCPEKIYQTTKTLRLEQINLWDKMDSLLEPRTHSF